MINLIKEFCYFLLDLAFFRRGIKVRVNDFPIVLPTRYFRYFPAQYEPENFSFFRQFQKTNMQVVDIGAHFGLYSVFMQKVSKGSVYSFEPTPSTLAVLKKTLALNGIANKVEVIAAAVADRTGKATFFIEPTPGSVSNSLVFYDSLDQSSASYEVDVIALDDFVRNRGIKIDFIKIDAEGAELSVLKGAAYILATQRPAMILALHPKAIACRNETKEMIWDFLKERNYKVLYNRQPITAGEFLAKEDLFDVHLVPGENYA